MRLQTIAASIVILAAAATSSTEELRVELDPESTTITFELKATLHTVHGTAELEHAEFLFDTDTGDASGAAAVAAASADTDNKKRDKKMHTEVLLSDSHPEIVLRAQRLDGDLALDGSSDVTLVGEFELLGDSHSVRVPMTVTMEGSTASVDANFTVPYVEWGLDDPSTFVLRVAKEVPVTIRADNVSVTPVPPPKHGEPTD